MQLVCKIVCFTGKPAFVLVHVQVLCVSPQSRQSLEKAKAVLEEERMNLSAELKTLQGGKMESERGRKRAEGQLQEVNARLLQADREREEREERLSKLQVKWEKREEMGLIVKKKKN